MMTLCDINLPVLVDDEIGKTLHINILIKTRNFLKYQEAFLRKFLLFLSFILLYFHYVGAALRRDYCSLDCPGKSRLLHFKISSIVLHRRYCPLQFRVSGLGFVVGVSQIDGVQ